VLSIPLLRAQVSACQAKERQILAMDEQPLPGRMPASLRGDDQEAWPAGAVIQVKDALRQYPDDRLYAWKVGLRMNSPKNNYVALLEPVSD
jgi:putative SOS response-associated peptidase YedK